MLNHFTMWGLSLAMRIRYINKIWGLGDSVVGMFVIGDVWRLIGGGVVQCSRAGLFLRV